MLALSGRDIADQILQNFLVDNTGHVKLTDFGLATGALNPQKIESMKQKASRKLSSLSKTFTDGRGRSSIKSKTRTWCSEARSSEGQCTEACEWPSRDTQTRSSDRQTSEYRIFKSHIRANIKRLACLLRSSAEGPTPTLPITGH